MTGTVETMRERAAASGFADVGGVLVRHDDVYVTRVVPVDGAWSVWIENTEAGAGRPAVVVLDDAGRIESTSGIDADTFATLYPELVA